jgi:hypothetical protein
MKNENATKSLPMVDADIFRANEIARRIGYVDNDGNLNTVYNSTSDLIGLSCLPSNSNQKGGMIIKTECFGFLFIQDEEDLGIKDFCDHSPGPWKAIEEKEDENNLGWHVWDKHDKLVATIEGTGIEAASDAFLISGSPSMRALLKDAVGIIEECSEMHTTFISCAKECLSRYSPFGDCTHRESHEK